MAYLADARYEEQIRCVHVHGKMMSVSRITLRFGRRHHERNWDMGSLPITHYPSCCGGERRHILPGAISISPPWLLLKCGSAFRGAGEGFLGWMDWRADAWRNK